ncbi:3-oxoadipate enol-lactone hydrolase [Halobiforma nitratireducens JCM 10879]|uniref:3-oxoadipate enol-lactone hydrolase n=1 Tax=Halobiforma nitratireducens JCM 10879 TaxID=1227454 RepID=M0LZA0_9EURY|nr:3-oxoadipate enol-lactone hydrolase [Halobiforma nitratireducens JCM 10879]
MYEGDGPEGSEPVPLLEDPGYGKRLWRWQRRAREDEYRSILFDNRVTGKSDAPPCPYTFEVARHPIGGGHT